MKWPMPSQIACLEVAGAVVSLTILFSMELRSKSIYNRYLGLVVQVVQYGGAVPHLKALDE